MLTGYTINVDRLKREITADRKGAEIARELGIHRTYLYKKLHGTVKMTLEDLNRICKVYGRNVTEFLDVIDLETTEIEVAAA